MESPSLLRGARADVAHWVRRARAKAFLRDRWLLARSLTAYTEPRQDLIRLGSDYGGWWVPASLLGPDSVVYSVGVGEDITFDVELATRFACTVHGFDPTPRALRYVRSHTPENFVFIPVALWTSEGTLRLYAPATAAHVSLSVTDRDRTGDFLDVDCDTLAGFRRRFGHDTVDLLKMDIEGAEAAVLEWLIASSERPAVIAVECERYEPWWRTRRRLIALIQCGYTHVLGEGANHVFVRHDVDR
jgi:FkbM family methyltransferase